MSEPKRIFIALHDQDIATDMEALLVSQDYQVMRFGSSRALLAQLQGKNPDLLLLDVLLPDGNGLELCKRLKAEPTMKSVKIMVISTFKRSAKFSMEARTKFLVDQYFEMPIDPPVLFESVADLLGVEPGTKDRKAAATPPPRPAPSAKAKPGWEAVPDDDFITPPPRKKPSEDVIIGAERATRPSQPTRPESERVAPRRHEEKKNHPRRPAPAPFSHEPLKSGQLGPVLLPELLLNYYQARANGTLVVKSLEEQREIILRDGIPVAIRSNFIPDDSLGQLLIARGLVDRATVDVSLTKAEKENRMLGEVLLAEGNLALHELNSVLRTQAKRKLNSAFRWKEGVFDFREGELDFTNALKIEQSMLSIIIAGIVRHYDMAKLEERLFLNKDAVVERTDATTLKPDDLNLTKHEWRILNLVDGRRTLGELIADADLNFARTFQVLYLFLLFGLVRFKGGDLFFRLDEAVVQRARSEAGQVQTPLDAEDEIEGSGKAHEEFKNDGDLAQVPLVRFLYYLYSNRVTGTLTLAQGNQEETISIAEGMPVKIHSNRIGPNTLGNMLIREGKITELERDQALAAANETGRPLGETLLAKRLISPHELFEALIAQIEQKLVALFTWQEGSYHFEEEQLSTADALPITVDITKLVVRSIRESIAADRIDTELRKYRSFPLMRARAGVDLTGMFGDPRESALVAMIDGRKTLGEILDRTLLDSSHAMQMIYSLLQLGLIKFKED
ncbi:MAG TPA: DUF4388 domain-containing protein [bacterium]|nr:DUF4388 domain-containing protein [bacterium]